MPTTWPTPSSDANDSNWLPVVAIGASAGGLEAFELFFNAMPADSGIAFILIAHLDPTHVSLLSELIQKHTPMKVLQIRDDMLLAPDHVYVIPPNKNLTIRDGTMYLLDVSLPRGVNLPIDFFFRALAKDQGDRVIGIVLSGTGTDATLGLKAIKGENGLVLAQDEASAKYDGMPRSAISAGLCDYVLPPQEMPKQIIKHVQQVKKNEKSNNVHKKSTIQTALQKIYAILRTHTHHDFSLYKKSTIYRRIVRRMNIHQIDHLEDYVRYLENSASEVDILFKELLIGVTNFFRDIAAFDALGNELRNLLASKPEGYTIRVWVAGCSTGEEAYSIAIILQECMTQMKRYFNTQIFATDLDGEAVHYARAGLYPENIVSDVTPKRIQGFFDKENDGQYRVKKFIREMLVFAPQSVISDPPFTKLDILSCRNLLIYLGPELQRKLLPLFHYSLKSNGILFLGSSESIGQAADLFTAVDQKWKIYRKQVSIGQFQSTLEFPTATINLEEMPEAELSGNSSIRKAEEISALQLVESILRESDTSPCVIIDDNSNVIYIHGRTGRYLEPAEGKISFNIIDMARMGLRSPLASMVRKVALHKQEVTCSNLHIEHGGNELLLNLTVKPILERAAIRGLMMVVFEEQEPQPPAGSNETGDKSEMPGLQSIGELQRALQYTKEDLQTTIEELEAANEELKSTNEELQSTNEELQSTNEEMETSKEELQSLNEESITVNAELQGRIDDLSKSNDDVKNLLDSTNIATIFLNTALCVRRFTPRARDIIPLTVTDSGRPISHFNTNLIDTDLDKMGRAVLEDLAVREAEVLNEQGEVFAMKVSPYRTTTNVIDGVVITFSDITEPKKVEKALRQSEERFRSIFDQAYDSLVLIDAETRVLEESNHLARDSLGYSQKEFQQLTLDNIHDHDAKGTGTAFIQQIATGITTPLDGQLRKKDGTKLAVLWRAKPVAIDGKKFWLASWKNQLTSP